MNAKEIKKTETETWRYKPDFDIEKTSARSSRVIESLLLNLSVQNFVLSDKDIINVGGGHGQEAEFLLNNGAKSVTVLDISRGQLENVCIRKQKHHLNSLECIAGDAENLPFKDGSFDLGYIFNALHHFPSHGAAISEICRVSTEVIFVDIMNSALTRAVTSLGFFKEEWCGIKPNRLSEEEVKKALRGHKLDPEITYFFVAPVYTYNQFLIRLLISFFKLSSRMIKRSKKAGSLFGNVAIITGTHFDLMKETPVK